MGNSLKKAVRNFFYQHAGLFICTAVGCFAGLWGVLCGLVTGAVFDRILIGFLEERRLRRVLDDGRFVGVLNESFPGAFYAAALTVFCLHDMENSVYQLKSVFGKKEDWHVFCRAAYTAKELNGDLLVECLAASLKKSEGNGAENKKDFAAAYGHIGQDAGHNGARVSPVNDIFRLLSAAEFLWDEKLRGEKPSHYLAELLNYTYVSDEIAAAYRVLGLDPETDIKKVRSAHRRLAAKFHPDSAGADIADKTAAEYHKANSSDGISSGISSFMRIQAAYETILHQSF
ncbi:J domain-containing protein [Treponema parvum]|uniref:J domain-containing protein n=1 Tax=Treponema parvum TaxID=138851 RepID=UPI001AEC40B7|nr:J domain-containing protein [Treponema parvum]QTQ15525.1 J domain-containing protein [Treponema parvum]